MSDISHLTFRPQTTDRVRNSDTTLVTVVRWLILIDILDQDGQIKF